MAAPHGGELPFVFDWVNSKTNTGTEWRDAERKLAETMSTYWLNFAATGDPNGKGLVRWPAYDSVSNTVLLIDDGIAAGPLPHKDELDFLGPFMRKPAATR
jgi:carboxylesterase type B